MIGKKPMGALSFKLAWRLGSMIQAAFLPFGVRPPITAQGVGIMGADNDVSNRRAKDELGWRTRVSWEDAKAAIAAWVREEYRPPV